MLQDRVSEYNQYCKNERRTYVDVPPRLLSSGAELLPEGVAAAVVAAGFAGHGGGKDDGVSVDKPVSKK